MTDAASRFEIVGELGQGAHGRVTVARDRASGAQVALKRVVAANGTAARARIGAEIAALRRVDDPHVVKLHEVIEETDAVVLVMELALGDDFVSWVRRDVLAASAAPPHLPLAFGQLVQPMGVSAFGPCGEEGITRLRGGLAQLAGAVEAIHRAGLVHGDLRPANVRVRENGRLMVIDLGLATPIGAALAPERSVGVVSHLAPELGAEASATAAIDWYAVGVLLFECLTGDVPFAGTGQDVFVRKQTVAAPTPGLLVREVPDDLDALCAALLATDPRRRARGEDVRRVCEGSATI